MLNLKKRIILIGAGNIGSRHLQAIVKLPYKLEIDIVEKEKSNFEIAEKRLLEINFKKEMIDYSHLNDIDELKKTADLVIVATNSNGRAELVSKLIDLGNSRFVIEKIVTQSVKEYKMLLEKLKQKKVKAWVNTARPYFESYQKIKEYFEKSGPIHISVNRGNHGLGCNAIHFINLFSYLCNDYKITLNGNLLYNKIFSNKRGKQYLEFAGTIIGSSPNGSSLTVTFAPHESLPVTISILGKDKHLLIEEEQEKMHLLKGEDILDFKFKNELQSSLTTRIIQDIIEKDSCLLPTLEDSSYVHYELFRIFNTHIKNILNEDREICPIT